MFKKVAAEALGLGDLGKIIGPEDFDKVDADDYVNHEEDEKIYFLIKSKQDEYCFTNRALIHIDGDSAISSKRLLKRYDYNSYQVQNVFLETAGRVDLDVEIKFTLSDQEFSIDVDKNQLDPLKDLYKALLKIASIQKENLVKLDYAMKSLQSAEAMSTRYNCESATSPAAQFKAVNEYTFNWMSKAHDTYIRRDFGEIFALFINN